MGQETSFLHLYLSHHFNRTGKFANTTDLVEGKRKMNSIKISDFNNGVRSASNDNALLLYYLFIIKSYTQYNTK